MEITKVNNVQAGVVNNFPLLLEKTMNFLLIAALGCAQYGSVMPSILCISVESYK